MFREKSLQSILNFYSNAYLICQNEFKLNCQALASCCVGSLSPPVGGSDERITNFTWAELYKEIMLDPEEI